MAVRAKEMLTSITESVFGLVFMLARETNKLLIETVSKV